MGIVHRDLKPSNMVVEGKDSIDRICLIDFGLSCNVVEARASGDREKKFIIGSAGYIAPEI